MTKVIYIISNINKAKEFEWVPERIDKSKFQVQFISINAEEKTLHRQFCIENNIPFYHVPYSGKKNIVRALLDTYKILREQNPEVVHAHLFEGGLIGITAAFFAGIKKRIYTRHYATQHHEYAKSGVKYDKIINRLSTHIVATSLNVKDVLIQMEKCNPKKVVLIHHGFPLNDFSEVSDERIQLLKNKYNLHTQPVIGVISRYLHLKGIQYIIPAFRELLARHPSARLVLANAKGEFSHEVKRILKSLPEDSYIEIEFETDNAALFKCFDIFVHVPINSKIEAFGQIYIEALAAAIPSIFTLSGVASEFIVNKQNALVVDFENSSQILLALEELIGNVELKKHLIENGLNAIKIFSIEQKIIALENLYL